MGDEEEPVAVPPEDLGVGRLAQPSPALRDRVEHWLDVRGRTRDHPEDLACGRFLVVSLSQRRLKFRNPAV